MKICETKEDIDKACNFRLSKEDAKHFIIKNISGKFFYKNYKIYKSEIYYDGGNIIIWWKNNFYHREDGPAIIRRDKSEEYWAYGRKYASYEELLLSLII